MTKWLCRWRLCTRGQGVIEYAFILCFVALGLVLVLLLLRKSTENSYSGVRTNLDQAVGCEGSPGCSAGLGAETGGGGPTSGSTSGVGGWKRIREYREAEIDNEGGWNGNGGGEKGKQGGGNGNRKRRGQGKYSVSPRDHVDLDQGSER